MTPTNHPEPAQCNLLADITIACQLYGIPRTRFGRDAVRDPRLVDDMRRGRKLRHANRVRILLHLNKLAIEHSRGATARKAMAALHDGGTHA